VAQAPLAGNETGKKSTVPSFWHMVWQHNVRCIIMVADVGDDTCAGYWPLTPHTSATHGQITVTNKAVIRKKGYTVTTFSLSNVVGGGGRFSGLKEDCKSN
jgi:protein tyrosine phosphatase